MRSNFNFISAGAVIAICGLIFIGCKDKSSQTNTTAGQPATPTTQIAVIAKRRSTPIGRPSKPARKAAAEFNVNIIWTGPDAETNHSQQANMVDDMANKGVNGIVLAPTNFDALVRPVESAVAKGIPVVLIDSTLNSDKPISVIATDNYAAGRQAAEALIAAMGTNTSMAERSSCFGSSKARVRPKPARRDSPIASRPSPGLP